MRAFGSTLSVALAVGALLLGGQAMVPAQAGLGQTAASVEADRTSMKGQLRATSGPGYSVQEITAPNGVVVREYLSPAGVVFAVRWSGPVMPDLQQTLGSYFTQLKTAVKTQRAKRQRSGHNRLEIHTPSLVVHVGGHMRQHFGFAYVPSLLPPNITPSDLN